MPEFTDYGAPVVPVFIEAADAELEQADSMVAGPPIIDVWYGSPQDFGQIGNPQPWLDILGNVRTDGGGTITSLTYKLNGGGEQPLALGPDRRRLARKGDFHIELDKAALSNGANTVTITATDSAGQSTPTIVTVNYAPGNTWPQNYSIDWATAANVHAVAQPVDGNWTITGDTVRIKPEAAGYDRLLAIGDISWENYEVSVPFTVYGIDPEGFKFPSSGPGIGMILRWPGYFQLNGEQPREGWQELGALGWHRWVLNKDKQVVGGLQMIGYSVGYSGSGNQLATNPNVQVDFGVPYVLKMSVQSMGSEKDVYRFKVWPKSLNEPSEWQMVGELTDAGRPASGSMALIAHHVDVAFEKVVVKPTSSISPVLNVSTDGSGSVTVDPAGPYEYGDVVSLSASPAPGNLLARWGGDLDTPKGRQNQIDVALTQSTVDITAFFVPEKYGKLTVNSNPAQGAVVVAPQSEDYLVGETVTVKATPTDGFRFKSWTGDVSSARNPYSFVFGGQTGGDTSITANYEAKQVFSLTLSQTGEGTILKDPDKAQYYENDVVQLTAKAAAGYKFRGWSGDLTGFPNPSYIAMTGDKSVGAVFEAVGETFTLDVSSTGPGTVLVQPDKAEYLYGESVTLTAVPNDPNLYMLGSWGGDLAGNTSPYTFNMFGDYTITATFVDAVDPRSDDFNRCLLENGRWTTLDPLGDSTFTMTGTSLQIEVPAGSAHDIWTGANNAPRALTPATNDDFGLDVKFDTVFDVVPGNQYQSQGVLVQESNDKFLRFDFYNDGSKTHIFAATLEGGTGTAKSDKVISNGSPLYMRIARQGDQWTQSYSYNGINWTQAAKFTYALNVTKAGLFAGNSGNNPAFTADIDYFFNSAAPIVPQDTNVNTLSITTLGQGSVTVSPEKETYACGEQVQLTAVPDAEWDFAGWAGDLSGLANPATLTITRSQNVTANFTTGVPVAGYRLYMPVSVGSKNN